MTQIFHPDFLDELEEISGKFSLYEYIMWDKNMSFHDAVLETAKFCQIEPKYWGREYPELPVGMD